MTTSPSWFDSEKFSSQVKKIGAKSSAPVASPAPENPPPKPRVEIEVPPKSSIRPPPAREVTTARLPSMVSEETTKELEAARRNLESQAQELARITEERNTARREYGNLREDFETLNQENARLQELGAGPDPTEWENEKAALQEQMIQRDQEINDLQMTNIGMQDVIETFKQELNSLHEQISLAQEETENARRDLEASQTQLQEVQNAFREKEESTSLNNATFENLKKECSTLVQQNMLLQAQHDQLSRELSAARAKVASKG